MKKLCLLLSLVSMSTFASINDIECESVFPNQNLDFQINVERNYNQGPWKNTEVLTFQNGQLIQRQVYTLSAQNMNGFNQIKLWGQGVDLSIDLWPDAVPRFGRTYSATYRNMNTMNNYSFNNIECRFP